jgi:predicted dehydrogenase
MVGQVDAVMIDHRDGRYHVPAARLFLKAGLPLFIDKPLSTSLRQARAFLRERRARGVPVTTLSSVPHQASVAGLKTGLAGVGPLRTVHLAGPGDPGSPYGGIFFYGIHQAELLVELLGTGVREVAAVRTGTAVTLVAAFPDGPVATISLHGDGGLKRWSVTAVGGGGEFRGAVTTDPQPYLVTTRMFAKMFRTGREPMTDERMLAPVALLDAAQRSLAHGGRAERVGALR